MAKNQMAFYRVQIFCNVSSTRTCMTTNRLDTLKDLQLIMIVPLTFYFRLVGHVVVVMLSQIEYIL